MPGARGTRRRTASGVLGLAPVLDLEHALARKRIECDNGSDTREAARLRFL
jgi:hypothetical protein